MDSSEDELITAIGRVLSGSGPDVVVPVGDDAAVVRGAAVRGSGAGPGDVVVVTGSLGGAAAGRRLARLGAPWTEEELDAIRRQERPAPRVGEAPVLARNGATAMIDVSDGLTRDLVRICEASGVGVRLDLATVPR